MTELTTNKKPKKTNTKMEAVNQKPPNKNAQGPDDIVGEFCKHARN